MLQNGSHCMREIINYKAKTDVLLSTINIIHKEKDTEIYLNV